MDLDDEEEDQSPWQPGHVTIVTRIVWYNNHEEKNSNNNAMPRGLININNNVAQQSCEVGTGNIDNQLT